VEQLPIESLARLEDYYTRYLKQHAENRGSYADLPFPRMKEYVPADQLGRCFYHLVDEIPYPPLEKLGLSDLVDLKNFDRKGLAFDDTAMILKPCADDEERFFHELVHIMQYKVLGVRVFLKCYTVAGMLEGPENNLIEEMAVDYASDYTKEKSFHLEERVRREIAPIRCMARDWHSIMGHQDSSSPEELA